MNTANQGESAQPTFRLLRGFLTCPTPVATPGEAALHPSHACTAARWPANRPSQ